MNKLGLPDAEMAERGMTPEQRRQHREKMRRWREQGEQDDGGTEDGPRS